MPVEVFVHTGERTALSYPLKPRRLDQLSYAKGMSSEMNKLNSDLKSWSRLAKGATFSTDAPRATRS